MSTRPSVLAIPSQSLVLPFILATLLHGCVGGTLFAAGLLASLMNPRKPLIDVEDTMEVSLVQLKHSDDMPTRATVAPPPVGEMTAPAPPEPTPVKQSDLAHVEPKAKPQPKGFQDQSKKREELMRELERQKLIDEALSGAVTREATSNDSTATESINAGGRPGRADPELARYVQSVETLFKTNFKPLQPVVDANPGIKSVYNVDFDPDTGRVLSWSPHTPSGNASYDAAVERAIQAVSTVPLPPEKFREIVGRRFTITFEPP